MGSRISARIGISLGNIGSLHDGLGEFSLQLGRRIAAVAPLWRERDGISFDFHLREALVGLFGADVGLSHRAVDGNAGFTCSRSATRFGIRCTSSTRTGRRAMPPCGWSPCTT